ncbi:MAG: TRAP transporter substrate-binding protein DctP [Sediminispirochaetaceae bacterium]
MSLKKIALIGLIMVVAVAAVWSEGQSEKVWKVGHVRPQGTSTDTDLVAFTEAVDSASNGSISIEVFPASQLGNYTVVQERVGIGDVEMQLAPASNSVTKALSITAAPYLVTNWEDAQEMFAWGGKMMTAVEEMLAKENIKVLAQYPKYFGGVALAKEPAAPKDPYAKQGLKIRVPGIKSFEMTATALGFLATPIPFSEAFTAMQTGIVDGVIGSGAEGYWSSFRDLTKYYLPVNSHFEMWFLYMNKGLWDKLSAEEQEILQKAAREMEAARWKAAPTETKSYEDQLAGIGVDIIRYSDSELEKIAEKVREEVWPEIKGEYGAELFDSLTR